MFNSKEAAKKETLDLPQDDKIGEHTGGLRFTVPRRFVTFDTETTGIWTPQIYCPCPHHQATIPGVGQRGLPVHECDTQRLADPILNDRLQRAREKDGSFHEPIEYGMTIFHDGQIVGRPSSFIVMPGRQALRSMMDGLKPGGEPYAIATHGMTEDMLKSSYDGNLVRTVSNSRRPDGLVESRRQVVNPALDRETGVIRAAQELGELVRQGYSIVNANTSFDLGMLNHLYRKVTGLPLQTSGLDLHSADIIDVIEHQRQMENSKSRRKLSDPTDAVEELNKRKSWYKPKEKDTLCDLYGVTPGGHTAADDARSAGEVLIQQVATNNGEFTPTIRLR